jgi:hypothetical protein
MLNASLASPNAPEPLGVMHEETDAPPCIDTRESPIAILGKQRIHPAARDASGRDSEFSVRS